MSLKDVVRFGTVLPHRSATPLSMAQIKRVAQRAEALGFEDLWVTENTLDHAYSLDPFVILSYAAAVTTRVRLGVAVVVLPMHSPIHIAHQALSLDHISNGRLVLGIGLGRPNDYSDFQVPMERRVRRFREGIAVMKALWTQQKVNYEGEIFRLADAGIALRPVQQPHPPLWLGGSHPDAVRRAVRLGDGWMGGGAQAMDEFSRCVPLLLRELEDLQRPASSFTLSKRVFIAVHKDPKRAKEELQAWFTQVYRKPQLTDTAAIHGTPAQVADQLERFCRGGVHHVVLNPVARYEEQVEMLAEIISH